MDSPERVNDRWSMDFVSDQLSNGRRFRVLNVVDDFSREVIGQLTEFSISGARFARFLDRIVNAGKCWNDNGTGSPVKRCSFGAKGDRYG